MLSMKLKNKVLLFSPLSSFSLNFSNTVISSRHLTLLWWNSLSYRNQWTSFLMIRTVMKEVTIQCHCETPGVFERLMFQRVILIFWLWLRWCKCPRVVPRIAYLLRHCEFLFKWKCEVWRIISSDKTWQCNEFSKFWCHR